LPVLVTKSLFRRRQTDILHGLVGRAGDVPAVGLVTVVVRPVVQHGDAVADQLDVAQFLGGDAGHQFVERAQLRLAAEVEALKHVVPERGHLAVLAAQQLLQRRASVGVFSFRRRQLGLQLVYAHEHRTSPDCGDL